MTRRVAAVTGAAQGLGAEIAIRLAADGFDVALLDIQADRLEKTSVDAEAAGAEPARVLAPQGREERPAP